MRVASPVFLVLALSACAPRAAVPPALAEARRWFDAPRERLAPIARAFERYQAVAAGAPEGPYAAEAAYALGLLALDLHVLALPPFGRFAGLHGRLAQILAARRVPAAALPLFAQRAFTVARDQTGGPLRERAEWAIDLAGVRERTREMLEDLAQGKAAPPVTRLATLDAIHDLHSRIVAAAGAREIVERAVVLQRVTTLALLDHLERGAGCPVVAHLARTLLRRNIDPDRPAPECLEEIRGRAASGRARLVRRAWVQLEEFALDRPKSPLTPLVRRLLRVAPPEGRRPP